MEHSFFILFYNTCVPVWGVVSRGVEAIINYYTDDKNSIKINYNKSGAPGYYGGDCLTARLLGTTLVAGL